MIKMNQNLLWELFEIHVISRCGIFNGQTWDLPLVPAYQYNHIHSLSHFPYSLCSSLCLTYIHCFTVSPLPLQSVVQTSYTHVAISTCAVELRNSCSGEVQNSLIIYPSFFFCLPLSVYFCLSYCYCSYCFAFYVCPALL